MRLLNHLVLVSFAGLVLASCTAKKPVVITNTIKETITETVHDTVFEIQKDSSSYQALLECINGKVVQKEIRSVKPGKNVLPPKVTIIDNVLTADCIVEAQKLFAQWKSTYISKNESEQVLVEVERDLTFTQQLFIRIGQFASALLLLILIIWIINKQLKAYSHKI